MREGDCPLLSSHLGKKGLLSNQKVTCQTLFLDKKGNNQKWRYAGIISTQPTLF